MLRKRKRLGIKKKTRSIHDVSAVTHAAMSSAQSRRGMWLNHGSVVAESISIRHLEIAIVGYRRRTHLGGVEVQFYS